MILDLRQFEHFPAHAEVKAGSGEFGALPEEIISVKDASLSVAIQKADDEYFCQGTVNATVTLTCSRCLAEFDSELSCKTDFIARSDKTLKAEKNAIPDDEDYVLMHGNDLRADVTDIVRQTMILSLGLKPLCSDDCKGLCPRCGANLNERSCTCRRPQIDERWSGLKGLSNN
jgi:uncharacterized protein